MKYFFFVYGGWAIFIGVNAFNINAVVNGRVKVWENFTGGPNDGLSLRKKWWKFQGRLTPLFWARYILGGHYIHHHGGSSARGHDYYYQWKSWKEATVICTKYKRAENE